MYDPSTRMTFWTSPSSLPSLLSIYLALSSRSILSSARLRNACAHAAANTSDQARRSLSSRGVVLDDTAGKIPRRFFSLYLILPLTANRVIYAHDL